ncbi:ATP-dependent DNA helicase RecG [Treponema pedis]|uniref:ATP-dependent DNA helicase RecG n=4 Tax=Treponema pedis TaxID=409322 RepID=S5ZT76_9SPIR|nr:ATP-dependent DNA helicase RecG [Treponema pedis]AGT43330.1 ATP-dependent DNA helicase RecG [Treponema pedis str. T A4]
MLISEITAPVTNIAGVGSAVAARLKKLGVENIGELLRLFPRDWEDRTKIHFFSDWKKVQKINVPVMIIGHQWFGFGKMRTLKLIVADKDGTKASLICFNRPFMEKSFPVGTDGVVYGSFYYKYGELQSSSFELEKNENVPVKILPVYPLTAGLGQSKLRKIINSALKIYARGINSELPEEIIQKYSLPSKQEILFLLHTPQTLQDTERGKYALIFEEFFILQYAVGKRSLERRGRLPSLEEEKKVEQNIKKIPSFTVLQTQFLDRLPFKLTEDQLTVTAEVNSDLDGINPMARLIQGDVGSGKTLAAFLACIKIIEQGGQAAFLAPTELLARQHAENAARLLEPLGIRLAFLTGNVKARGRSNLLRELENGNIDLIIGTHSLFSAGVNYKNLRLAVIDEQHRFGVLQRSAIIQKGIESRDNAEKGNNIEKKSPHILMMSATPIPRTLALSVFGDLDISTIRTMPQGRKPVITYIAGAGKAERVYSFIGGEILKGRQAYFVYPLIEENEELSLKSAERMFEELKQSFPSHKVALIHSKIAEEEQRRIMEEFRSGAISILTATSVVEVGVDVPNATCIVIEHADRFGLSALHQMRGRVGRGSEQAYCFLLYGKNLTENGRCRLTIMKETTDGFKIAEEDLKLRGPGDIGGVEQSGYLGFKYADPIRDYKILQTAREAAFELLQRR